MKDAPGKKGGDPIGYLVEKYPWFDAAQRASSDCGGETPVHIALAHSFRYAGPDGKGPHAFSGVVYGDGGNIAGDEDTADSIIERFLEKGGYRIVAVDGTPEVPVEAEQAGPAGEDFMTEEMAAIYMSQGAYVQAVKIYEHLSLLNPEKSIYFAEIIDRANESAAGRSGPEQGIE